jgi:UDP-N-acetylmuramate--alanine ligase
MSIVTPKQLADFSRIHFIGIGGIGMSSLARLCVAEGKKVSGSDRSESELTSALRSEGVIFYPEQVAENITEDIDLVVYTEAMAYDHEELVAARARAIPTLNYFDALGMVANEYYLIAVAGSHGKTTTTAMLADIFEVAGLDPSVVVGSLRAQTNSNYRAGKSKYFIAEACEYKRDFLSLMPDILVITNIEHEHVDYYQDLVAVQAAFRELAHKVPAEGFIIANLGDERVVPALAGVKATVIDYRKFFAPLRQLTLPGVHNQMNAAAAVAAAAQVGITVATADAALAQFAGTWRRFEYKGEVNGAKVYDDYGHHPTEVTVTIRGARELYPQKKLTVVFQPHMYSRTHELFTDFVTALTLADRVILVPIYAAREENESGVTHLKLAEAVREAGGEVSAMETLDAAVEDIRSQVGPDDVVLVMGAGTVTEVATTLTK